MNIPPTSLTLGEREQLSASARLILERGGSDLKETWRSLTELGLSQIGRPSGAGGLMEGNELLQEIGRSSSSAPLTGSILINLAAALTGNESDFAPLLEILDTGNAGVVFAFGKHDGDVNAGHATYLNNQLCGEVAFVEGTAPVTDVLVAVEGGLAWVSLKAATLTVTSSRALATEELQSFKFEKADATFIPLPEGAIADLVLIARLCSTAYALGAARAGFEEVLEYVKIRKQFGQPIGRFQAIQHKLANCHTQLEAIRLSTSHAAEQFDLNSPDWRFFAAATCAFANHALRQVALDCHHTFGAIGYSEEHTMPRHFRRIHTSVLKHGGLRSARELLAEQLLGAVI